MYKLSYKTHFDAAHKLELDYSSPCQRLHGHRWNVVVEIVSKNLDRNGMIIDFKKIKNLVNELDHRYLNEVLDFNPTAENIAKYLYNKIADEVLGKVKVTVYESPDASITYENEETF